MDLNKLRTFTVVVDQGSFSQAATQLRRSQSAISQQIQSLEDELDVRLLERVSRKIYLSKEGRSLYDTAKPLLSRLDDEASRLQGTKQSLQGHIRIGLLNSRSNLVPMATTISRFCLKHPEVSIEVLEASDAQIEQGLLANKIDLGLMVHFDQTQAFRKIPLNLSRNWIVTSHQFIKSFPVKLPKELIDLPLIDLTDTFACFGAWFKVNAPKFLPSLKHRKPRLIVENHQMALDIVAQGYGITMAPEYMIEKQKNLIKLFSDKRPVNTGLDIVVRTGRTPSLAEKLLIESIRSSGADC